MNTPAEILSFIGDFRRQGITNDPSKFSRIVSSFFLLLNSLSKSNSNEIESEYFSAMIVSIVELDLWFNKGLFDYDKYLELWKLYLYVLKSHSTLFTVDLSSLISETLSNNIIKGFQKTKAMSDSSESIIKVLFFLCQRVSATVAFLRQQLSEKSFCSLVAILVTNTGVLTSLSKVGPNEEQVCNSNNLIMKALSNPHQTNGRNDCNSTCPIQRKRYHEFAVNSVSCSFHPLLLREMSAGIIQFAEHELKQLLQNDITENYTLENEEYTKGSRVWHCLEEILTNLEYLCFFQCGYLSDEALDGTLERCADLIHRILCLRLPVPDQASVTVRYIAYRNPRNFSLILHVYFQLPQGPTATPDHKFPTGIAHDNDCDRLCLDTIHPHQFPS